MLVLSYVCLVIGTVHALRLADEEIMDRFTKLDEKGQFTTTTIESILCRITQ